jgi:hypothetical protein
VAEENDELRQLIDALTEQVKSGHADIAALMRRADASDARAEASDVRADRAEARADASEARADKAEARADQSDVRADIGDVRVNRIEAAVLADREIIAELQADGEVSREHTKQLQEALRSTRVIGAAIGMLMVSRNLTQDQAFDVLKKASQNSNQRLRDIARLMVEGDEADGSVTR